MYEKEAEDQRGVVDKLINENGEEWYIKNAVRVLLVSIAVCDASTDNKTILSPGSTNYLTHSLYPCHSCQQRKMLEESLKMVTKGQTSLAGAVSDLKELVVRPPFLM